MVVVAVVTVVPAAVPASPVKGRRMAILDTCFKAMITMMLQRIVITSSTRSSC